MVSKILRVLIVLLVMAIPLLPIPAFAIADPITPPNILYTNVFYDVFESGDIGVLIQYYLDQTLPVITGETATESFLGIFIDDDGVTQLKAAAPYAYHEYGYHDGAIWIYFTAAEAGVTGYNIDRASAALYRVWVTGNPTLTWTPSGIPSKTIGIIDSWEAVGASTPVVLANRVISLAQYFTAQWVIAYSQVQTTPLGTKLSIEGEVYFQNMIPGLRTAAPAAFANTTAPATQSNIDYSTAFGAVLSNGTGSATPITLVSGVNTVHVTGNGTLILTLTQGTVGTPPTGGAKDGVNVGDATVAGSPVALVKGVNTITVATGGGASNITVTVALSNTQTKLDTAVIGTGFDVTTLATLFGMSRQMLSGLVWLILSIVICAASYKVGEESGYSNTGKSVMLIFELCVIGGTLLGLLSILIGALLFILWGGFIGYIIFFRGSSA